MLFRTNKKAKIEEGEVYYTQQILTESEYVNIFATMTKDEEVKAINLMGAGDGTEESGMYIIGALGATIAATQPNLQPELRGEILEDLGVLGEGGLPEEMATTISGEYEYSF